MKQFSDVGAQKVVSSLGFRKSQWSQVKVWMSIFLHTLKLSRKIVELMVEKIYKSEDRVLKEHEGI